MAEEKTKHGNGKICIIRIRGKVGVQTEIEESLSRLRLRKKYACVVLEDNKKTKGALKKVKDFVAFGEISSETYKKLVEKRGRKANGKLKPFFRLHPPRGGIDSKVHFGKGKGVLGNNGKDINKLVERML